MIRKALLLLSGNAFGSLMLLIRNLLVARLISVEDYGIAATFAISMAVVEMASGLGLQQLIVQAREGDDPKLQAGLQGFNLMRGAVSALILFLLAHPIAQFLGIPDVAWAYQAMALVPLMRGFEHFDVHRMNREMRYGPLILTKAAPALISLVSLWPLILMFQDYRVMLYAILLQWALMILTGHLMAQRRFALSFDGAVMRRALGFGWPIMVSNALLFLVMQGDKLIVGRALGMEDLALFAMGVTLTLTPTLVMDSAMQPFFLPQLSKLQDRPAAFETAALTVMQTGLACGVGLVVAVFLLGPPFVHLAIGPKYAALPPLLMWLAIAYAIRMARMGCTVTALSKAYTGNVMAANLVRILALPAAWLIVQAGGELIHVAWAAIAGEIGAYVAAFALLTRRARLPVRGMIVPLFSTAMVLAMAAAMAATGTPSGSPAAAAFLTAAAVALYGMASFRRYFGAGLKGGRPGK